jgi:hypothetical protein
VRLGAAAAGSGAVGAAGAAALFHWFLADRL